jgi:type IV pilus assembly protein PilQ
LLENQGIVLEDFVDPVADNAERIVINQETVQDPNAESASTPVQVDPDPAPIEEVALSPTQPSQGGLGTATTTAIATTNPPVIGVDQTGSLIEPEQFATESMVKVERTVAAGPDLEDTFESGVTPEKRELVSREEPKNYMDLNEQREDLFPITINLDDVDIRDAMTMLSEVIGKNILVGDEVGGTISVRLINVPWNKALDAILQIRKLAKHVNEEGTIIRIHEQAALIAQEAFERQRRSDLIAALEAEEAIGPLFTEIFRLFYTEPKVVKKELQEVLGVGETAQGAGAANT